MGKQVPLLVSGKRIEGALVSGLELPGRMILLLPSRIGEPDKRVRVDIDKAELAPYLALLHSSPCRATRQRNA